VALSLSSAWTDPVRLAPAVAAASEQGFHRVFAAHPPADGAAAKRAAVAAGVSIDGVAAPVGLEPATGLARAVEAAAFLRVPTVVLESPRVDAARPGAREAGVEALARTIHATLSKEPGLRVAVRHGSGKDDLLGIVEMGWLLSELSRVAAGAWLDPWRASREAGAPGVLDWADRMGSRVLGLSLHGDPAPRGFDLPSAHAVDWRALREGVPGAVPRVLDVGPHVSAADLVDCRRRFEESLGY
jgi:hypothetical protein